MLKRSHRPEEDGFGVILPALPPMEELRLPLLRELPTPPSGGQGAGEPDQPSSQAEEEWTGRRRSSRSGHGDQVGLELYGVFMSLKASWVLDRGSGPTEPEIGAGPAPPPAPVLHRE